MHTSRAMAAAMAVVLAAATSAAQVASNAPKEEFTAFAVNMSNVGRTGTAVVDLTIERWTTDAEHERFIAVYKEKGQDGLLNALRGAKRVGTIRTPDSLAYDLRYARQLPRDEGGRQIILATDRPIGFWEATARPRSFDYPFTLIELQLDKKDEGVGKLSIAARIALVANVLLLEDYADQPVMLNNVHKRK